MILGIGAIAAGVGAALMTESRAAVPAAVALALVVSLLALVAHRLRYAAAMVKALRGVDRAVRRVASTTGKTAPLVRDTYDAQRASASEQSALAAAVEGAVQTIPPLHRAVAANATDITRVGRQVQEVAAKVQQVDTRFAETQRAVASMSKQLATIEKALSAERSAPPKPVPKPVPTKSAPSAADQFAAVAPGKTNFPAPTLRVGVILDEFSEAAFKPEWQQHKLLPGEWERQIEGIALDLLFVESAWSGNDGAWRYQLVGSNAPSASLVDLVRGCRDRGIPTVFWNKEDPPHFEDFIDTAALFDWVLTSDGDRIPEYRDRLRHDRVAVLPFAAQPALHNPGLRRGVMRDLPVAFGGMYFSHKYPERRAQMDFLLPAVADLGLDIYSRHANGDVKYAFPAPLDKYVRGALPYPKMIDAYKRYKVMLSVNSVVESPSMCARRIFEVSACGGVIVSPPSAAIPNYFEPDEVVVVNDATSARNATRALVRSVEHRDRIALRARRRVWAEHTYGHRVDAICEAVGITQELARAHRPGISVLCSTIRPHLIEGVFATIGRQTETNIQLVLNLHGAEVSDAQIDRLAQEHGVADYTVLRMPRSDTLGACLNAMVDIAAHSVVAKMDDDDFYGRHYLQDLLDSYLVSGAEIVGKAASYVHFEGREQTILSARATENRFSTFVRGATLLLSTDVARRLRFGAGNRSEDTELLKRAVAEGLSIYASDRFNYCVIRNRDLSSHTWRIDEDELFAAGDLVGFGDFRGLVEA
ncbi:glycosyltransferase [Agrococcus sp. Ld7]|uniref:glycosyltransferase family protein n=1 Tax=Agrococcus sp. Ld7 TaxID=649148 RepID=UPI0038668083